MVKLKIESENIVVCVSLNYIKIPFQSIIYLKDANKRADIVDIYLDTSSV